MIPATKKLISIIHSSEPSSDISYINEISKYGGLEDAIELFRIFMEDPQDYNRILLLEPIRKHGDLQLAQVIYDRCFYKQNLRDEMPSEILHVLGYLGYTKCTETLVSLMTADDWHISKNAVLGLLHLPCNKYESQIKSVIDESFGKNLFDEFVPALSYKVLDSSVVPKLFEWGDRSASVDCNAGIILGIALFGPDYKHVIKNILWNQNWEAHGRSTGTCVWSYVAMQHVRLTFKELMQDIRNLQEGIHFKNDLFYRLNVLFEMLKCKLTFNDQPLRFTLINDESVFDIHQTLFESSNDDRDDSIIGLITNSLDEEIDLLNKYYHLKEKFEMKIEHMIELDHLAGN
ncbi:hypothetical protein [Paenibacillus sp. JDR-2]|uniref:hypothetical protein n=1 Tax=Paenibacillus sp. (strain JDR-2) TaxID=324057 RepID=UPI0001663DAA|nr:hypothetical protein [Paenibacillus sp. JDR-2]ACT02674.1 hypothetical protein Pjdr2_4044 [Paenibacillus sp. JDR-2]